MQQSAAQRQYEEFERRFGITEIDKCNIRLTHFFLIIPTLLLTLCYANYSGYHCPPHTIYIDKELCYDKNNDTVIKHVYYEDRHQLGLRYLISGAVFLSLTIIFYISICMCICCRKYRRDSSALNDSLI